MLLMQPTNIKNIWTNLDDIGAIISLGRRDGESLLSFKERIMNAFTSKMNSTYEGLTNSILSGFSLEKTAAIKITPVDSTLYPKRQIVKTDNLLLLCKYFNSLEDYDADYSIELFEKPYITINKLVDYINTFSTIYQAELITLPVTYGPGTVNYWKMAKGFTLLNSQSIQQVTETVYASNVIQLKYDNLINGELFTLGSNALTNEVYSEDLLLNSKGNYYVNYTDGLISLGLGDSVQASIIYKRRVEPFYLYHSPIVISTLFNEANIKYLFVEELQKIYAAEIDKTTPSFAKDDLIQLMKELLAVSKLYWGE